MSDLERVIRQLGRVVEVVDRLDLRVRALERLEEERQLSEENDDWQQGEVSDE